MDKNQISNKLLEKIDMAIESIAYNRDPDYNEKASCVVCNLAAAFKYLSK